MDGLKKFLNASYTPYHAVENAEVLLTQSGFIKLGENENWNLKKNDKYYVSRGGALIAFAIGEKPYFKIAASHTDSPCLKLKDNPVIEANGYYKLNTEPYGGGIWYSFFDRPLKIAGRVVKENDGALRAENFCSDFNVILPSLAVHMQRDVNEKFSPNLQTELPLLSVKEKDWNYITENAVGADLFVVCAEEPFECGAEGELLSSPRIDNLTSVYSSLKAIYETKPNGGVNIAAFFNAEEIGSHTMQGAGGDFLKCVLERICGLFGGKNAYQSALSSSFLLSVDNAHAVHPNHTDKADLTNRPVLGGGVTIKSHAGGAYTTEALSFAALKKLFARSNVTYQTFYNRSDMRSGSTLGAISIGQASMLAADIGIAQLAMHSAVETIAKSDYSEMENALKAFYESDMTIKENEIIL